MCAEDHTQDAMKRLQLSQMAIGGVHCALRGIEARLLRSPTPWPAGGLALQISAHARTVTTRRLWLVRLAASSGQLSQVVEVPDANERELNVGLLVTGADAFEPPVRERALDSCLGYSCTGALDRSPSRERALRDLVTV